MDTSKFTQKTQEAVSDAQRVAVKRGHQQVDVEHLLHALVTQADGLVPRLLQRADITVEAFQADVEKALSKIPSVSGSGVEAGKVYITDRCH